MVRSSAVANVDRSAMSLMVGVRVTCHKGRRALHFLLVEISVTKDAFPAVPPPHHTMPMSHITLPEGVPGILGPMTAYPETAVHLLGLAEVLLRGPSSLTQAERELIAAFVSRRNDCYFCSNSHAAVARYHYGEDAALVDQVLADLESAPVSEKLRALLRIAATVRGDARQVSSEQIDAARAEGADDQAIHDTVLIAAAFCMYNRYVDGLATLTPRDPEVYAQMGERLGIEGYVAEAPAAR